MRLHPVKFACWHGFIVLVGVAFNVNGRFSDRFWKDGHVFSLLQFKIVSRIHDFLPLHIKAGMSLIRVRLLKQFSTILKV